MALLKEREMVFKEFESGIFSRLKESEQLNDDAKYNSFGYDMHKLSKNLSIYYKTSDFRKCKTIRFFSEEIRNNTIDMHMTNDEQNKLAQYTKESKTKTKPQNNSNLLKVKEDWGRSAMTLLKERELVLKAFKNGTMKWWCEI